MLNDKIENVHVFDAIVKKYAEKTIEGKTDAELTAMLRELARRFDTNFDTLYKDYQADALLDKVELLISEEEKRLGMQGLADCSCIEGLKDDVDDKM